MPPPPPPPPLGSFVTVLSENHVLMNSSWKMRCAVGNGHEFNYKVSHEVNVLCRLGDFQSGDYTKVIFKAVE